MAVIPVILLHDRAKLMKDEVDWFYGSDIVVAWVDEEDLVDDNDNLIKSESMNKSIVLEKAALADLIGNKPKTNQGGFDFV